MSEQTQLIIEIKNKKKLEFLDFTKAMTSLASQYNSYTQKQGLTNKIIAIHEVFDEI